MTRGERRGLLYGGGAILASLLGHVLTLVVLPVVEAHYRPTAQVPPQELELFVEIPPPQLPDQPATAPVATARPAPRPDRAETVAETPQPPDPETPAPDATPDEPPPVTAPPPQTPTTVVVTDPRERPPETVPRTTTPPSVLDTRAVARAVLPTDGPRMPRAAETSTMDVETPEQRDQRLAGNLDATLRTATTARPEGFGRRVLPEPVHRPDGSLAYALGQVTAIVNRDGTFTFDDTAGVDFEGMGNAERQGMTARWGLEEWMMRRHGADPHASTRRWFANQTESLREEMMTRHMETQARTAARGMRGRMGRLLADETRTMVERRRALFDQWDDCSEGELIGDAVRTAILEVVRDRLPEGSPDAYPTSELDELNRRRASTAEFRPYAH